MDLNFKCLGKNIGPMIVEILRPFEFGMKNAHSDGQWRQKAHGSLELFAHRGSKNKVVIFWKVKTVQITSSFLTMISILFYFCHLKNSTFLHILSIFPFQKAITTWHLWFTSIGRSHLKQLTWRLSSNKKTGCGNPRNKRNPSRECCRGRWPWLATLWVRVLWKQKTADRWTSWILWLRRISRWDVFWDVDGWLFFYFNVGWIFFLEGCLKDVIWCHVEV